jgi:farnesyl diphosphate synthase
VGLKTLLADSQARVETTLARRLPAADYPPTRLHQAMRYAVLGGGKRVRPVLVYATGRVLGVPAERLDAPACAVELIHAYSLVHDDLPAMDDDDLRRGKPTCHKAYDEATAILVGDALQSLAFELLATDAALGVAPDVRCRMLAELAGAAGSRGMVGGQAIDMDAMGRRLGLEELETMHRHKTGALIRASVRLAVLASDGFDPILFDRLTDYADAIGLAFQIRDDILDVEADTVTLGKPQGSDAAKDKPTYTALLGLDGAKTKARELHRRALGNLEALGERADPLRWLADYIVERAY